MNDIVRGLEFVLELQICAEKDLDNNFVERKGEDEVAFLKGKEGFSGSEQSYATTESIKGTSGTIFSEINDSEGR
ncbi:receptor-like protein kinase FERONIA [Prunus yedoensis var. nudiflora]|uniref:Receptor-like protein kinase FERONIA n=1 Tax=Prunus yedoensis var. nudiflora TaxID=2094558 RepID=A0A314XS23_PRUYE|nr:receptor-like protein kinase FERONIA [Prunus yedoensis var. nudiflora]